MTNYLEALNMKATKLAQEYCTKYNEGKATQKELKAAKKAANDAMAQYNLELSKEQYLTWANEGNPIELAIRSRVVPNALKFTFKADDEDVMMYGVKGDDDYAIDLLMMEVVLGAKVFHDAKWFTAMESLMYLTMNYLNERCGNGVFNLQVEKASASFKFPKGVDPLSDEGVIIALQNVFDKILFLKGKDGKNIISATSDVDSRGRTYSREWTVIRESMTKSGGVNKVIVCNTAQFSDYIVNAMHGILTHGEFGLTAEEAVTREDLQKAHEASEIARVDAEKSAKKAKKATK